MERSRTLDTMNRKPSPAELISGNGVCVATLNGARAAALARTSGNGVRVATLNGARAAALARTSGSGLSVVARFEVFRIGSGCPSPSFSRRNSGRRDR